MERKRFVLAAALGCLIAFGSVSAQEETGDNDTYEKFRVGGYGEMVANFKDYGINRYWGNKIGNTVTPFPFPASWSLSIISSPPNGC